MAKQSIVMIAFELPDHGRKDAQPFFIVTMGVSWCLT